MKLRNLFSRQKPQRQMRREPTFTAPALRRFDIAQHDVLTAGWEATNVSADTDLASAVETARGRARNLCNNNDYARKFLQMVANNIVGPDGFMLISQAADLGQPDKSAQDLIESGFFRWATRGTCEITGAFGFNGLLRMIVKAVARDGEALVRKLRGRKINAFGYALQLLDIDRLPVTLNLKLSNGNAIVMGVEINSYGQPVAYHLHTSHPGENTWMDPAGNRLERVPAEDVFHLFVADRPEQRRGITWLHSAAWRLEMLGKFESAAVAAARKGAETLGFFTREDGLAPGVGEQSGADEIMGSGPCSFDVLPPGVTVAPYDTKYPSELFGVFRKDSLRGIASGMGVAYNNLSNDLEGVNYSSIRAGMLEERDHWMVLQGWLIETFLEPLFQDWLKYALLAGQLAYPNGSVLPLAKLEKFSMHRWQGRRWSWVDPEKDVAASVLAISNGLKSPQRVAAEMGVDIEDVLSEIARFQAMAKEKGVTIAAFAAAASGQGISQ